MSRLSIGGRGLGVTLAMSVPATYPQLLTALIGDGSYAPILAVTGDSTSNDPIDWAYKLGVDIAARYPSYTYHYHL